MADAPGSHHDIPLASPQRVAQIKAEALACPSMDLDFQQVHELELLMLGALRPLRGYLGQADYEAVLDSLRLADGTFWPLPICLHVPELLAGRLSPGQQLLLRDPEGFLLAVLHVEELWQPDVRREALALLGTDDPEHPGVRQLLCRAQGVYAAGRLEAVHLPAHHDFAGLWLTPESARQQFAQLGWRRVLGCHVQGVLHRGQREMLLAAAREHGAGILLQPAASASRHGDARYVTRVRCAREFARHMPGNLLLPGLIPAAEYRAGPRETLLRAVILRNYGCTHFLSLGQPGDLLVDDQEPAAGIRPLRELIEEFQNDLGITMVPARPMVYVEAATQYLPVADVGPGRRVQELGAAELRRRLDFGLEIPEWFSFPDVVAELRRAYPPRHRQGFTVFFTGLSGAGKSTVAKILYAKFAEQRDRPVTLLDGDIVRKHLSRELTFSREHREINIQRIGFVASEITKNGGIAICAPIAPYPESRRYVRELVAAHGGFVEVHMSAPLEVCEGRDRKGLYARARAGLVSGVTGIDDPYIPPEHPELRIDTSAMSPSEATQQILMYLVDQGYLT